MTNEFDKVQSTPTLSGDDIANLKKAYTLAAELRNAEHQAFTEADIRMKALEIAQMVIGIAGKFLPGL